MYIIGITAYYHDSSVCLFRGSQLIFACEEEKFTGIKHDNSFPIKTLEFVFKKFNLKREDIECVCYYEKPILRLKRKKSFFKSLINTIKVWYNLNKVSNKIHYCPHHLSHMYYSFISSDFTSASVISIDGVGETETISIGKGFNNKVEQIKTYKYPNSLGLFYSTMTSFLGFKPNEGEYKVMGLASYGDPSIFREKIRSLIYYKDGELKSDMSLLKYNKYDDLMFDHDLENFLGIPCRLKDQPINLLHQNLAASVQERYEEILFEILKETKQLTNFQNLCLGGGCAYNGTANGKIVPINLFKHLWIPPAPSDAGSSIGSCLHYLSNIKNVKVRLTPNPFLGPNYTNDEVLKSIEKYKILLAYKFYDTPPLLSLVSDFLNGGLVVGWFQGRIEFGARALGNRSILANPKLSFMKDRINSVIKKREGFRPFAPMVTYENQNIYFESREFIPYMNQVVKVRDEYREKIPAVTHVDGTARVQSVLPSNPIYDLLKEFEKKSGFPILLNTSFNVKDKTMVLSPDDAIETFLDTDMDILVINNYIITKTN